MIMGSILDIITDCHIISDFINNDTDQTDPCKIYIGSKMTLKCFNFNIAVSKHKKIIEYSKPKLKQHI